MYSPKIDEELIPVLYRLAKQEGKTMTRLVDEIIRAEIGRRNIQDSIPKNREDNDKVKKKN